MKYLLMSTGIFLTEYLIKDHVEKNWQMGETKKAAKGRICLRRYHNRGAFLNLGEKRSLLVAAVSVGLTVGMAFYFVLVLLGGSSNVLKLGFSWLLGGAFSNTYDRMKRKYVVDYFSFHTGIRMIDRMIFNLADFAILAGAMISVICAE